MGWSVKYKSFIFQKAQKHSELCYSPDFRKVFVIRQNLL